MGMIVDILLGIGWLMFAGAALGILVLILDLGSPVRDRFKELKDKESSHD